MVCFSRLATVAALFTTALVSTAPIDHGHSEPTLEKRAPTSAIYRCKKPGTIAITFDDGPWLYTGGLLDILKSRNVKATFFFNGFGWGHIDNFATVVKRAFDEGHQVASHTWDHKDLALLSESEVIAEMTQLDDAFKRIIGVRPTYMRPPFGSYTPTTLEILHRLNYTAVSADVDTRDWVHPTDFEASYNVYKALFDNPRDITLPGHIVLNHETHRVTSLQVAPMAIDLAKVKGYKVVTVGECLGDPKSNWYRA
ncbi:hypothetical protein DFQ26_003068 [Actinomortierella ambigua]|nr:hypothetical protein DFQ26_003068 [Actinomortierella ambigua]